MCAALTVVLLAWSVAAAEDAPIQVQPAEVVLTGPAARFTLLVDSGDVDGFVTDLTRDAAYRSLTPDICAVSETGVISSITDGNGRIQVRYAEQETEVSVVVRDTGAEPEFNFERDIVPILSRYGCNSSGCHGKAEGQNGFKLSVFGFDPAADYGALRSENRGRRLSLTRPEQSLLLRKACGDVPHGGGVRIARDSVEYSVLRNWVAAGAPFGHADDPRVATISMTPRERVMRPGAAQQVRIMATYTDGWEADVTALARFQSNNEGLCTVDDHGLVTAGQTPGDAAVMVSFMGHVDVLQVLIPQPATRGDRHGPPPGNDIDELVDAKLKRLNIVPSELCSDGDFVRRAFLDIIGTLPTAAEASAFLEDTAPDKRERLVQSLLERPEYAEFWGLKWADLLRVDSGALGHHAAYDYYGWIRDSFAANKPWDRFARELLTADGALHDAPAGWFYKVVTDPGARASTLSQVFLGVRIECARCHHHPFDRWGQADYAGMQAFFVQPTFKQTPRGELLFAQPNAPDVKHPRTDESIPAFALGTERPQASPAGDRRQALADWMTSPENPYFAQNLVDRLWAHFTGRGLVEPVDDLRLTNPPTNPELLTALTSRFVESGFDVHELIRHITASRTYQLSATPNETNSTDVQNYSRALLKPLPAEVLLDALCQVTDEPEKFQGLPDGFRAIGLWDSQVPHYFLKTFGRPMRASACECERVSEPNVSQVLHLMNSPEIAAKMERDGGRIARWANEIDDDAELLDEMYLTFYSRYPTSEEREALLEHLHSSASDRRQAIEDVAWTLLNGTEFLFNH